MLNLILLKKDVSDAFWRHLKLQRKCWKQRR